MKVAWNTCDKELGGEMKSVKENCLNKSSLVNFQNSLRLGKIYVKYLEKNSIAIDIVYSYIFSFLYRFADEIILWYTITCEVHSIHL